MCRVCHMPSVRRGVPADAEQAFDALREAAMPERNGAAFSVEEMVARLDLTRTDRLRITGNGVVPLVAAYALRTLEADLGVTI